MTLRLILLLGLAVACGALRFPTFRPSRPGSARFASLEPASPGAGAAAAAAEAPKEAPGATGVAALPQWDPTTWVVASPFNRTPVRIVSVAAAVFLASRVGAAGARFAPFLAFTHVTSHSFWLGSMLYTTFIAGLTMFRNLPRQTFGKLQAKLFPQYFLLGAMCSVVELLTLPTLGIEGAVLRSARIALGTGLAASLLNLWVCEPMATGVLMQRYKLENDKDTTNPRYKELGAAFGKWHGLSSLVNLVAVCAAFAHSWTLGRLLLGM